MPGRRTVNGIKCIYFHILTSFPSSSFHPRSVSLGFGLAILKENEKLEGLHEMAERHYAAMYDASHPEDDYEDASFAPGEAGKIAACLHRPGLVEEIRQCKTRISADYDARFRHAGQIWSPIPRRACATAVALSPPGLPSIALSVAQRDIFFRNGAVADPLQICNR